MRCALIGGGELIARDKLGEGGEGVVYAASDGVRAVKLYHKPLTGAAAGKLRAMIGREVGDLIQQAAWPTALVAGPNGSVAGFVMPRAKEAHDIHAVYSPRDRREKLPKADWKFLVLVAANLAAAVHAAHQAGIVIGDINHGSVRVGEDARVRLIDCDSFQISHEGVILRCNVGIDAYTPPELQGQRLADIDRTVEHDRFGLAVLIFQLLFMGRHPFSGVPKSKGAPTDIPDAIAGRDYAYGSRRSALAPPPAAPPIAIVTADLAALFEQAFTGKSARPPAEDWHRALQAFAATLTPCGRSPAHAKPAHASQCPWCAFDHAGVEFFPPPLAALTPFNTERFDEAAFETAWNRLELAQAKIRGLIRQAGSGRGGIGTLPTDVQLRLDQARAAGASPQQKYRVLGWLRRALAVGVGLAVVWVLVTETLGDAVVLLAVGAGLVAISGFVRHGPSESLATAMESLQRQCRARHGELQNLVQRIDAWRTTGDRRKRGAALLQQIRSMQKRLAGAPRDFQLRAFLGRFPVAKGCAPGIGDARVAQLASFGIESAADVLEDAVLGVPGFGPQLAGGLVAWRRELEKRFRFNPAQPVNPADLRRLQTELKKPLADYRKEVAEIVQFAQALERNCAVVAQRSGAHDAALQAGIGEVVQAEAEARAVRLMG